MCNHNGYQGSDPTGQYQSGYQDVSVVQSSTFKFTNYGIVDIDIRQEDDKVIVTVSISGTKIGSVTLSADNPCLNLEGTVDVFGHNGVKVKVSVCADWMNKRVCVEGRGWITIKVGPIRKEIEVGKFSDCKGFGYSNNGYSNSPYQHTNPCLIGLGFALSDFQVIKAINKKIQNKYIFRGYKCVDEIRIPELVKVHLDFDCEPIKHCLVDPSLYVTVNLITGTVVHIEGQDT
ncbi:hypothetical protein ACWGKR_30885 [Bacillus thuringiensis]|uniref:hypothetical protein n=1 Tax=Bacillus cereus group TaxID=86661 RepID=UPI00027BFA9C|nr:hypothetical protein [Bacillus cereus]EJV74148.1 hypothetical protein IGE_05685 [Bacillus cereus HuB1-1]